MRQIIGGKIYDTTKAVLIAQYHGTRPFSYEELYRTPNGRYFLYASGACVTEYVEKQVGAVDETTRTASLSTPIRLITFVEEEVIAWAERRVIDPALITKYIRIKEA